MLENEELIPLSELPHRLPRRKGKRISLSTLYRWRNRGLRGVRLEVTYRLGQPCTIMEAVARFDRAVTLAIEGPRLLPVASEAPPRAAHELAKRRLAKALSPKKSGATGM